MIVNVAKMTDFVGGANVVKITGLVVLVDMVKMKDLWVW